MNTIIDSNNTLSNSPFVSKLVSYLFDNGLTVNIKGKIYPNKMGFRRLCMYLWVSLQIVKEQRVENKKGFIYEFSVRATSKDWRYIESSASCSSIEREFNNLENDVRAIAQTRASNRAVSELLWIQDITAFVQSWNKNNAEFENLTSEEPDIPQRVYRGKTQSNITEKQKKLILKLFREIYKEDDVSELETEFETMTKQEANERIKELIAVK